MPSIRVPNGIMLVGSDYKPGDQAPEGYLAWHEWAEIQHKAGLRQKQCAFCCLWKYPQELSEVINECEARDRYDNLVIIKSPVCRKCADERGLANSTD